MLHIFVTVFAGTDSHLFTEDSAEIMVVIVSHQESNCFQLPIRLFHQLCRFFHADSGQKGNHGFSVSTAEGFIGFICGIISQDHDLEAMYLDSFLKLAGLEGEDITATLAELDQISTKYHVNFVLSVSMDGEELPESAKDMVLVAL